MRKVFILLLITLSLYSADTTDKPNIDPELVKSVLSEIDSDELLKIASAYLEVLTSQENKDKANDIQNKIKEMTANTLKTIKSKIKHFNVQDALDITYKVKVLTNNDSTGFATAIALNSDGKLITAYHNIDSYKKITVIDNKGNEYTPKIGSISAKNDLAYLYIDVENIPYAKIAPDVKLGDKLYLLSHEKLLLTGIASQVKENNIIINVEAKQGTSGGGVFNDANELVAILLRKDVVNKTSFAIRPEVFKTIVEEFGYKKDLKHFESDNYDTSYCHNENDLRVWKVNENSPDLKIQEYHALFVGLCQKVQKKNLTTDEAQYIFESTKVRLFGN